MGTDSFVAAGTSPPLVYLITDLSNAKVYVGQTNWALGVRWTQHKKDAQHGKMTPLHIAMREHDNFSIEVIEALAQGASQEDLNSIERYWIYKKHALDPQYGYNVAKGGSASSGPLGNRSYRPLMEQVRGVVQGLAQGTIGPFKVAKKTQLRTIRYAPSFVAGDPSRGTVKYTAMSIAEHLGATKFRGDGTKLMAAVRIQVALRILAQEELWAA